MSTAKEDHVDALLCFMNDTIEECGGRPHAVTFDFVPKTGEDWLKLQEQSGLSADDIQRAINTSYARDYIKHAYMDPDSPYNLTTEGQGRAISAKRAKHHVPQPAQPGISIASITGPTQIGNHNTLTMGAFIQSIVTAIDESNAPAEDKEEAKSLLRRALEHPLTCSIVGAGVGAILGTALPKP